MSGFCCGDAAAAAMAALTVAHIGWQVQPTCLCLPLRSEPLLLQAFLDSSRQQMLQQDGSRQRQR